MRELTLKIRYEEGDDHNPNEGTIEEIMVNGLELYLDVDMETGGIIKKGWSVQISKTP
jgi:hypothetical protein